ncbi:MAG: hypothetical protein N3E36_04560 [Sulfolobales archaeon]|nr:hypothetical protein [Sulfolobales archaeon]MCX8199287.1 hypothetical protein [Sulfolobales archaeon]MDW8170399.1 hypothetical protein [Desulfurococcaceae archaeon]
MTKVFLAIYHKPEVYDACISIYNDQGLLIEEKCFNDVKQVVIKEGHVVRLGGQLSPTPFTLVIDIAEGGRLRYKFNGSTLIIGE